MQAGGWTLVHLWLTDAIASSNWPLVHEILELLLLCPVDVERLKSNTAPKLVKQLTKDEHPAEVKLLAETLVQQWLRIVRGEALPSGNTSTSDVTSENDEASQDVPRSSDTESKKEEEEVAAPKIVLKLSVKDGKNVIIKKNDVSKEESGLKKVETPTEEKAETLKKEEVATGDAPVEKKQEKDKKKSSSSSKSSSSKSHHSLHKGSSSSSSSSSSSKHKSSSSSSSKNKDKDKEKDRHKSLHHKSSSSSSKSSSSRSASRSEKEKKKDKEPEMSEADKVAKTLAELEPEKLTKLGKIPKKSREGDEKKTKPVPAAPAVPKVKPTFSIEERDPEKRSKTVKTLNSKFRSHGLEEEAPPPPSRKVVKKPSTTQLPPPVLTTGIKRVSPPRTSIGKDPLLSPPVEKKPKLQEEKSHKVSKPKSRKFQFYCNISNKISSFFFVEKETIFRGICTRLCCFWQKRKEPHWFILYFLLLFYTKNTDFFHLYLKILVFFQEL